MFFVFFTWDAPIASCLLLFILENLSRKLQDSVFSQDGHRRHIKQVFVYACLFMNSSQNGIQQGVIDDN
jgi:hypothetical protein